MMLPAQQLQQEIPVWPGLPPGTDPSKAAVEHSVRVVANSGERVVSNVHKPTLTIYLPPKDKATGAAVLVIPGGGHRELWSDHEGHNVAKWLVERGVAGFVLKHRLAREKDSTYTIQGESLADTRQALQLIQGRAAEWNLRANRIGVMGFSAGGELAALVAATPAPALPPAFQALIYPAIPKDLTFQKDTTPPAFLACGENDRQNISQGLPELYLAMKKAGVSAELHVYANTGHGFGVRPTNKGAAAAWLQRFHEWLGTRGLLLAP